MSTKSAKRIKLDPPVQQAIPNYVRYKDFRIVLPYDHTYHTHVKARWFGHSLLSVFQKEFRDRPAEYYEKAIKKGWISVNDEPLSDLNRILKSNDKITHRIHRHEPAVLYQERLQFCENDAHLILDKPASIPVHPTGRYYYNTILEILRHEHPFTFLSNVNRLDRLTSGLLIVALSKDSAKRLHQSMQGRTIHKEYIARVQGDFPDVELTVEKRLETVNFKLGLCCIVDESNNRKEQDTQEEEKEKEALEGESVLEGESTASGKDAITMFKKLKTFADGTSLVHCRPLTGRTHQIRVHLQYLGFPIVNDVLYDSSIWQEFAQEKLARQANKGSSEATMPSCPTSNAPQGLVWSRDELWAIAQRFYEASNEDARIQASIVSSETEFMDAKAKGVFTTTPLPSWFDMECEECQRQWLRTQNEPSLPLHVPIDCPSEPPSLCLHAYRYYSNDWDYSVPWPEWAKDDANAQPIIPSPAPSSSSSSSSSS